MSISRCGRRSFGGAEWASSIRSDSRRRVGNDVVQRFRHQRRDRWRCNFTRGGMSAGRCLAMAIPCTHTRYCSTFRAGIARSSRRRKPSRRPPRRATRRSRGWRTGSCCAPPIHRRSPHRLVGRRHCQRGKRFCAGRLRSRSGTWLRQTPHLLPRHDTMPNMPVRRSGSHWHACGRRRTRPRGTTQQRLPQRDGRRWTRAIRSRRMRYRRWRTETGRGRARSGMD